MQILAHIGVVQELGPYRFAWRTDANGKCLAQLADTSVVVVDTFIAEHIDSSLSAGIFDVRARDIWGVDQLLGRGESCYRLSATMRAVRQELIDPTASSPTIFNTRPHVIAFPLTLEIDFGEAVETWGELRLHVYEGIRRRLLWEESR